MMRLLRKHRQWLMIVIAVLALPFVFYFVQKPDYSQIGRDQAGQIYGHGISFIDVGRAGRLLSLGLDLGMEDFVRQMTLGVQKQDRDEFSRYFAGNLLILQHEADRLGIHPASAEIVNFVRNLPVFRGPSGFDAKKYEEFAANALAPNGFTEAQIEELVSADLCFQRIKELLAAGVAIPQAQVKSDFEDFYGRNFVSLIRLHASDMAKEVKVTDDEVQNYYDAHKVELKTEEKRKVDLAKFTLNDAEKKLTGRERVDVLQKLQDRASDFTQALTQKGADFRQLAAKFQASVEETGEFTASSPDPKLKGNPKLSAAAFQLAEQQSNSDIIEEENGYYVLHLAGIAEARPLTLAEAKPKIVDTLKADRERQLIVSKGMKAAHDLREGLKAGEPLSFAMEQVNVKGEKMEPFIVADNSDAKTAAEKAKNEPPEMNEIKNVTAQLQAGEVSDFLSTPDGGMIIYLEKREPPDKATYAQNKAEFDQKYLRNKRQIVFYEWLHSRQVAANLQFVKS